MKDYAVSLVVPVYNIERYLPKCLDSLVSQTYQNLEIILVDDGSQDRSGFICDSYGGKYENIRVLHKENGGLISAWRAGVHSATGDYITFVDGDDWIDRNMIEELAEELSGSEREVVCSDYIIERELRKGKEKIRDSEPVYQSMAPGVYDRQQVEEKIIPELLGNEHRAVTISRCMKLISASLIRDNEKYCNERIRMAEDAVIMLPVLMDAERIVIMDRKAYYHYQYIGSSMVHKYDRGAFDNVKLLYEQLSGILKDKFEEDGDRFTLLEKRLDAEFIFLLLFVMKNEIRNPSSEYLRKIKEIGHDEMIEKIVKNTPVKITEKSNRLLYNTLKSPNTPNILILRMAMKIYDARY